jgi:DNA-binding transcriptional MerR regulator
MSDEITLAEMERSSGVPVRTIRSWIEQDLLPRPLGAGPKATYPAHALTRLLAIKAMRDTFGMSLAAIRQELIAADSAKIETYAAQAGTAVPAASPELPSGALDYLARLRAAGVFRGEARGMADRQLHLAEATPAFLEAADRSPLHRLADTLEKLAEGRKVPRRAKGETQTGFSITPDIELVVRGALSADEAALYERVADHLRDILTGGQKP